RATADRGAVQAEGREGRVTAAARSTRPRAPTPGEVFSNPCRFSRGAGPRARYPDRCVARAEDTSMRKHHRRRAYGVVALAAASALFGHHARAATRNWDGSVNQNWNAPGNWLQGVVPNA